MLVFLVNVNSVVHFKFTHIAFIIKEDRMVVLTTNVSGEYHVISNRYEMPGRRLSLV